MLQSRTEEVLSTDSWCEVQESTVVTLLQQDTLNIQSEVSLLSACQRWAQQQWDINNKGCIKKARYVKKLRKIMDPLLPYLRILSLTSKQFFEAIINHDIFSEHEQFEILKRLADPQKYKAPKGLCELTSARKKLPSSDVSNSCLNTNGREKNSTIKPVESNRVNKRKLSERV
jgi:hypothetical protein